MYLSNVGISQNKVRNFMQVPDMVKFVNKGGIFNRDELADHRASLYGDIKLISIVVMEDGYQFIRDGHHRAVSIHLGGRKFLYQQEFVIEKMTYDLYAEINFEATWVTPIDPHDYVRKADIGRWKQKIDEIRQLEGDKNALRYILTHQDEYAKKKEFDSVENLANEVKADIKVQWGDSLKYKSLFGKYET